LTHSFYLSTREAAVRLSIGASTLKKLRVNGGGPAFHRIGRRVVYSTDILDEWAKRATFESTSEYCSGSRYADGNGRTDGKPPQIVKLIERSPR
jgi:excisionase family DNA binding protein